MKIQKKEISRPKQLITFFLILISIFAGILASVIGIDNFKNYYNPYLFGLILGILGIFSAALFASKIKHKIATHSKLPAKTSDMTFLFSMGFIGVFLLFGHNVNSIFSNLDKCDNFAVIDKQFQEKGFRRSEKNILVINVNGENLKILCSWIYWENIKIGQKVNTCIYKSKLGFDYLILPEDN